MSDKKNLVKQQSDNTENSAVDDYYGFEAMEHPFFAKKALIGYLFSNVILFLLVISFPKLLKWFSMEYVTDVSPDERYVYLIVLIYIPSFIIGYFIGYSLVKLLRIYYFDRQDLNINSGFMSGYAYSEQQYVNRLTYLFAAVAGVLNFCVFFFLPYLPGV